MRDFLHSEISQIEGVPNVPDNPDVAIKAGTALCEKVLEPIQQKFGRISIRSAYRSSAVNARGAENKNQYNCSRNESNFAGHIWDIPDKDGHVGAMACIVVNSFLPYFERTKNWESLAWWIHDNVPEYASMYFFPKLCAFNIGWHQKTVKSISSYIPPKGCLTKPGMTNYAGDHSTEYAAMLRELGV
ncbi:hypothetical protein [Halomonas sp. I5-271120]|uniref:hypothetical protein n=1 Tax=Halomonas sp. I5-271120 TaxID=3061632 RepID=UPI0027155CA2|nr:hypothetical protein [Halomonas sp. I5-271120]